MYVYETRLPKLNVKCHFAATKGKETSNSLYINRGEYSPGVTTIGSRLLLCQAGVTHKWDKNWRSTPIIYPSPTHTLYVKLMPERDGNVCIGHYVNVLSLVLCTGVTWACMVTHHTAGADYTLEKKDHLRCFPSLWYHDLFAVLSLWLWISNIT